MSAGYEYIDARHDTLPAGAWNAAEERDRVSLNVWFLWRPNLRDPDDELVLEAAVNGQAAAIATLNRRDFRPTADRFGIDILLPAEAIRRVP